MARPLLHSLTLALLLGCDTAEPPAQPANDQARPDPEHPLRPPSERGHVPDDAAVVDYVLHARLDETKHRIDGQATIAWTNRSNRAVESIPMHLYLNGFRAEDTAWMTDGRLAGRTTRQGGDDPWGFIDVKSVERVHGIGDAPATTLAWAERDEPSLMDVQLDTAVAPGQTLTLQIAFVTQLPNVFARSGYGRDFHMVGQWFPKPGVLAPDGRWDAHPFTFHSEFFADFGDYEVHLDVPHTMAVGATGVRADAFVEDERRHLTYRASMVHDFAWVAASDLVEQVREHEGISIRQLIPADRVADGAAHLDMAVATLTRMQQRFSPYPWSTLTIVHPPPYAGGAGGMEYPTLFTTADRVRLLPGSEALGFVDRFSGLYVTTHELGHQWFQGLLASNEYAQPWLDEGLNSFSNALVYMDHFASDEIAGDDVWVASLAGLRFTHGDGLHLRLAGRRPAVEVSDQSAADFSPLSGEYGTATYRRTAAWLLTLRALTGRARFDAAMRAYAERFRFRHPRGEDLEDMLVEHLGRTVALSEADGDGRAVQLDVRAFLHQALRTPADVDFEVSQIEIVPRISDPPAGFARDGDALVGGDPPPSRSRRELATMADEDVESIVVVRRHGEFIVPVTLELRTDDGSERLVWDGRARYRVIHLPGKRVRSVVVDPDGDLYLEGNRLDNVTFAADWHPERSLGDKLGDTTSAAALAIMAGLGP